MYQIICIDAFVFKLVKLILMDIMENINCHVK